MTSSADLPPAFSARLRQREPILAEEDTNGLFQAFRAHRLRRESGRSRLRREGTFQVALLLVLNVGALVLPAAFAAGGGVAVPAVMWSGLGLLLTMLLAPRGVPGGMPESISNLFFAATVTDGHIGCPPLRDVWMVPSGGRAILICIYLEARLRLLSHGALRNALLPSAGMGLWVAFHGLNATLLPHTVALLPGAAVLLWGLARNCHHASEAHTVGHVRECLAAWLPPREHSHPAATLRGAGRAVVIGVVAFLALTVVVVVLGFAWPLVSAMIPDGVRRFGAASRWPMRLLTINIVLAVLGIHLLRGECRTAALRQRLEETLAIGEANYVDFMRRRVLEDPA